MNSDEKLCPYCAETIKADAIRCRYCKSDLSRPVAAGVYSASNVTNASKGDAESQNVKDDEQPTVLTEQTFFSVVLVVLLVVAVAMIAFNPGSTAAKEAIRSEYDVSLEQALCVNTGIFIFCGSATPKAGKRESIDFIVLGDTVINTGFEIPIGAAILFTIYGGLYFCFTRSILLKSEVSALRRFERRANRIANNLASWSLYLVGAAAVALLAYMYLSDRLTNRHEKPAVVESAKEPVANAIVANESVAAVVQQTPQAQQDAPEDSDSSSAGEPGSPADYAGIPEIATGTPYAEARQMIIAAGWSPVAQSSEDGGFVTDASREIYPETENCSGTGRAYCMFIFQDASGTVLNVQTFGEDTLFESAEIASE